MFRSPNEYAWVLFLVGTLSGCSSKNNGGDANATPNAAIPLPDAGPPTWSSVYANVVTARCAPCHTVPGQIGITEGNLDMTSVTTAYSNLVNVPAAGSACGGHGVRVVPGEPDSSVFYLKVSLDDPSPCGAKMPLGGAPLTQGQADLIEAWVNGGALGN